MGNTLTNDIAIGVKIIRQQNDQIQQEMRELKEQNQKLKNEVDTLKYKLQTQSEEVWDLYKKLRAVESKYEQALKDKQQLEVNIQREASLTDVDVKEIATRQAEVEKELEDVRLTIERARRVVTSHEERDSRVPRGAERYTPDAETEIMEQVEELLSKWATYRKKPRAGGVASLQLLASLIQEILDVLANAQEQLGDSHKLCRRLQNLREDVEAEGREISLQSAASSEKK